MKNKRLHFVLFTVLFSSNAIADSLYPKAGDQVSVGVRSNGTELGKLISLDNALEFTDTAGQKLSIGKCSDTSVTEIDSPNDEFTASVFIRNCGATVDFSTIVSVDTEEQKHTVVAFAGKPKIALEWRDDNSLTISHSKWPEDLVFKKSLPLKNFAVTYVADQEAGEMTDTHAVGYSSFNYGASGRAASLPADLLLRVAGWSQEASGLYRSQWGHWNGLNLCGDDPVGSKAILDGIVYFEQNYGEKKLPKASTTTENAEKNSE